VRALTRALRLAVGSIGLVFAMMGVMETENDW